MPSISLNKSDKAPIMDKRLPTCRNYWRFDASSPSPPQRPPSYLLKPHLIASTTSSDSVKGRNPNSKYYKLRHGPNAIQLSPLSEDLLINYHQYRVRLPFDPTPFRGVSRFAFWILFLAILILLLVLITALFRVEDLHVKHTHQQDLHSSLDKDILENDDDKKIGLLRNSFIFKTLVEQVKN